MSTLPPELLDAPEWLKKALTEPSREASPPPAPSPIQLMASHVRPLLIEAALVDHFLPRSLAPEITERREQAESQVTALATLASTSEGRGWALTPEARRQILSAALNQPDLDRAVAQTEKSFTDPVSRHLRSIVTRESFELEDAPAAELEARRIAVGLLHGTEGLAVEEPDKLDHAIELRRIVERFERMVGKGKGRRFFGRAPDIEALRAYIGEIGSGSFAATIQRALKQVVRTVTGRRALSIHGGGGVGKTTLLAHFVLEHIQAAANSFPFVYLDFDRTTISARAPAELLAEMCVQVTAQFPALAPVLGSIRRQALESAALIDRTAESADSASLDTLCYSFRQAIDLEFAPTDRALGGALPVVLVFDTFELVQANAAGSDELASFVQHFLSPNQEAVSLSAWPRLRLVISGRRPVKEFLGPTDEWHVDALDRGGSIELLIALAGDQGCSLETALAAKLVDAIALSTIGTQKGVRPLRLHLVAKALENQADVPPRQMVDDLIDELAREGSDLQLRLVDGILVRRILGHVGDRRVRDLSDPGLVVRYIDPDIIREVIAPVTPPPAGSPPSSKGYPLAPGEEREIFQAFRSQVSLIEDNTTYVRHIQDIRREMLPLIRARRPALFEELHARAYRFFRQRKGNSRAAGEAIYHGLWSGAPVEELERLWEMEPAPDPRLDPDEFAFHADASAYVRARTGGALRPQELPRLPPGARVTWLTGQMPAYVRSRRPEGVLQWLEACPEAEESFAGQPSLADQAVQVFDRTGRWSTAHRIAQFHLNESQAGGRGGGSRTIDRRTSSLLRSLVKIEARCQRPSVIPSLAQLIDRIDDRTARIDILLNLLMRSGMELESGEILGRLETDLAASRSRLEHGSRRLALLLVPELCRGILPSHVAATDSLPRDPDAFGATLEIAQLIATPQERERLAAAAANFDNRPELAFDRLDELFRAHREEVVVAAAESDPRDAPFRQMLQFSHFDWASMLAASLELAFKDFDNERLRSHVAKFTPKESQPVILSGRLSGRRTLAAIVRSGRLLELCRTFGGLEASGFPETFSELCVALHAWHLRLTNASGSKTSVSTGTKSIGVDGPT